MFRSAVPPHQGSGPEDGFSLIEMVVALTVLSVILLGLAMEMGSALRLSQTNRSRSIAANLASKEMDIVRSTNFTALPLGQVVSTEVVDGAAYNVARDSVLVTQNSTSGPCDGGSGQPAFLRVTVNVTWPNMSGVRPVSSQTVLTPPVASYDPNSGNLAVKVLDRDPKPSASRLVSLVGPTNFTQFTTAEGCAYFGFLPAGSYVATVSSPGYVDRQGVASPSQTVAVTVGTTKNLQFDYDQASAIEVSMTGAGGGTVPPAVAVVLANTALLPGGVKAYPGTSLPRTVSDLFPYLDGFEYWAGNCADADPSGKDGGGAPLYPGAARLPALAMTRGATTAATLVLASVDVAVTDSGGLPVAGATVTATHGSDSGCAGGNNLVVGTTDAAGALRASLPYGSWDLEVTKGALTGTAAAPTSLSPLVSTIPLVAVTVT